MRMFKNEDNREELEVKLTELVKKQYGELSDREIRILVNKMKESYVLCDQNHCGNCHKYIGREVKFCPYCGTKAGEGDYEPYEDYMQCVYGPPPKARLHKCEKCGKEWTTRAMVDHQKYCPECGGKAPIIKEGRFRDFDME